MKNNVVFTIEQVDNKLIISAEAIDLEKVEQPNEVDLSKYKAFPEGYIVPSGTRIRAVKVFKDKHIKHGAIGTIIGDGTEFPLFVCDNDSDKPYLNDDVFELINYLAPLDPTDHPDYKPKEVEQDRPMDAEQIAEWVNDAVKKGGVAHYDLSGKINALVQYEVNKAKR